MQVGSQEFEVIGVQTRKGKLGGDNLDNRIFVPLPLVTRVLLGGANTKSIGVHAGSTCPGPGSSLYEDYGYDY